MTATPTRDASPVAPRRCNSHEPPPDGGNVLAGGWRFWLTARRGATDPVCGMPVARPKVITNEFASGTFYFCSQHCLHAFEQTPDRYLHGSEKRADEQAQAHAQQGPVEHRVEALVRLVQELRFDGFTFWPVREAVTGART